MDSVVHITLLPAVKALGLRIGSKRHCLCNSCLIDFFFLVSLQTKNSSPVNVERLLRELGIRSYFELVIIRWKSSRLWIVWASFLVLIFTKTHQEYSF